MRAFNDEIEKQNAYCKFRKRQTALCAREPRLSRLTNMNVARSLSLNAKAYVCRDKPAGKKGGKASCIRERARAQMFSYETMGNDASARVRASVDCERQLDN